MTKKGGFILQLQHPTKKECLTITRRTSFSKYKAMYFEDNHLLLDFGKFDRIEDLFYYLRDNKKVSDWYLKKILEEFNI